MSATLGRMLAFDRQEYKLHRIQIAIARERGEAWSWLDWVRECSTEEYFLAMEVIDELIAEEHRERKAKERAGAPAA
jgi:hypothetical protein